MQRQPLPENRSLIIEHLQAAGLLDFSAERGWSITNLGAILFAANLDQFPHLSRKSVRVIAYAGTTRVKTKREQEGKRGYAAGFSGLISFLDGLLPENELIKNAIRESQDLYHHWLFGSSSLTHSSTRTSPSAAPARRSSSLMIGSNSPTPGDR